MTRNDPLVMQGVRRLVANVVGRGFVLDSSQQRKRRAGSFSVAAVSSC